MYKILKTYCPGGWRERTQLLQELATTTAAQDAVSAASTVRLWKRQRARALEASGPDDPGEGIGHYRHERPYKQLQASFRVSIFRMEVHLDERPTDAAVEQHLAHHGRDGLHLTQCG
eukprot:s1629_g12.t1